MVRLAAPRFFLCRTFFSTPFFAVGEKKCAGPFSPQAKLFFGVCFAAGVFFSSYCAAGDFFFWSAFNFFEAFFVLISC